MSSVPSWVVDTNVLVSAALTTGGTCDQIIRAVIDGRIRLAWSAPIVAEYRVVLLRPRFKFSTAVVSSLLGLLVPSDQVVPMAVPILPDRDDEFFLGTAMATVDKILVTGNIAHFPVDLCLPVQILTPAAAIQRLVGLES